MHRLAAVMPPGAAYTIHLPGQSPVTASRPPDRPFDPDALRYMLTPKGYAVLNRPARPAAKAQRTLPGLPRPKVRP